MEQRLIISVKNEEENPEKERTYHGVHETSSVIIEIIRYDMVIT